MLRYLTEVVSLQTSRGRLTFFILASALIFIAPYHWLSGLSIWARLGIDSPSIGLTRAYWHLLHFDFSAAWNRNRLIYLVLIIGLPLIARDFFGLIKNRQKA